MTNPDCPRQSLNTVEKLQGFDDALGEIRTSLANSSWTGPNASIAKVLLGDAKPLRANSQ
jgi:hypothetical protein